MIHRFAQGHYPDLAVDEQGGGILVMREGDPRAPGSVVVFAWAGVGSDHLLGLREALRIRVDAGSPAFCRAYRHDGLWWVAYHDGVRGNLRCVSNATHRTFEPCENNEPIALGDGHVAWQGASSESWPITFMELRSGEMQPAGKNGAGTGLAYIAWPSVVLVDENRASVPGLTNPVRAHGLIVGEDPDPNNRGNLGLLWRAETFAGRLWHTEPCLTPRCASSGPFLAITTGGQGSDVRLFVGTRADLLAASATPPVPLPLPIPPNPTPEPETPSMKLDPRVRDLLIAFAAKYPVPKTPGGGEAHEQRAREWSVQFCEQVTFSLPGEGYGTKRGDPNRPISKDTITQQKGGEMVSWDLLVGTGTGEPSLNLEPHGEVTTGQFFVAVPAVNHLGAVAPAPSQPPSVPPAQPTPVCTCAADVANVRTDITHLTDMLLMLPANLAGLVEQIIEEKLSTLEPPTVNIPPSNCQHPPAYEGRIFGQKVRLEPKP